MGAREGWYSGLSSAFLGVKAPKVLMLAGTDRLDRTLTVGQMQGKFQMVLLPQVISLYLLYASHISASSKPAPLLLVQCSAVKLQRLYCMVQVSDAQDAGLLASELNVCVWKLIRMSTVFVKA